MAQPKKLSPLQWARAASMLSNGKSVQKVAEHFGVHPNTIYRYRARAARTLHEENAKERERLARLAPCGTPAAYQRHRDHGEIACEKCLKAEAERKRKEHHNKKKQKEKAA